MQTKQNYDIPIHDIKPIVDVQEYSFYYFLGLIGLALVVFFLIVYILYRWYKKTKAFNIRVHHKDLLDSIDYNDTKNSAYLITNYANTFKDDNPENLEKFEELTQKLEEYKYRKNVENFDEETIKLIDLYKSMVNV